MARVVITTSLEIAINRVFKNEAVKVFELLLTLETSPKKGKELGHVGGMVIKELKYRGYRFYFITDGRLLRVLEASKLQDVLIKFVRMSDKKAQQRTIDEIKHVLRMLGGEGFS